MENQNVRELVSILRGLREELIGLKGLDVNNKERYLVFPPASVEEVTRFEQIGRKYPPSYRNFLELHNGWLGFWPDWSLVGVPRDDNRFMYEDIEQTLSIIPDELNEEEQAKLSEREKTDPSRILATNHTIFATDFNGGLMVFDQNRIDSDGEMEAVWVGYIYHVERRYPNFISLLDYATNDTRSDIAKLRAKER